MWPKFNRCKLSSANLSENYRTIDHTFTGTSAQKSAVTVVHFDRPPTIDFLPKQIPNTFPTLNGMVIEHSNTFKVLKNGFFTKDFSAIQYLCLHYNAIEKIETDVFQHLPNLKLINLSRNQIKSLPYQLFKSNPEMIAIWLNGNQINSITPGFFNNLNKLQLLYFAYQDSNECIKKNFGCHSGSCLIAQSVLNNDSDLSSCYSNCLIDIECTSQSGKLTGSNHTQQLIENGMEKFQEMAQELKVLSKEVADLKAKLDERKDCTNETSNLKMELSEIFKKEFNDFIAKLNAA
jgi:hypothetical protein